MLEAIDLCKSFDSKPVIEHFSARLERGGHYCLMGPSGCGKTTLLYLLMGLCKPDAGKVVSDRDIRFSAVFQEDRLLEQMNAVSNVALVTRAPRAEIESLLLRLGLARNCFSQPVATFSGGMKRRVALCRALMADSDILVLDEPYKGLDEDTKQRVMKVTAEATTGKTVLLVTHDPEEGAGMIPLPLAGQRKA